MIRASRTSCMRHFAIVGLKGEYYGAPHWLQNDIDVEGTRWQLPERDLPAKWMPKRSLGNDGGYVLVPEDRLFKWVPEITAPAWKHSFLLCAASGRGRPKRLAFGYAFEQARLLEIVGITDRLVWSRAYL